MMKQPLFLLIALLMLGASLTGQSQQASGYILFGQKAKDAMITCTKQGICKLTNTTTGRGDDGSVSIAFASTPVNNSRDTFSITFTVNLNGLKATQLEQYNYFSNTTKPYVLGDLFTFPTWLMDSLGFSAYEPIQLKAPWNLGNPPKPNAAGNITMILCGFVTSSAANDAKAPKKKKGIVLSPAQVKKVKRK